MKKKSSEPTGRNSPVVDSKPSSPQQSRKKGQEVWQDMVKFQQELIKMQTLEEDQDLRLMRLECILKRFQKNMAVDDGYKVELNRTARFYVNQLGKLDIEAKRLKISSQKKLHMLQELKLEADRYLIAVKEEQQRHYSQMSVLNSTMLKNLEKLKKIASEEFEELEALLKPSSRWIFLSKNNRTLPTDLKLEGDLKVDSFINGDRPKTQVQDRPKAENQQERPKTAGQETQTTEEEDKKDEEELLEVPLQTLQQPEKTPWSEEKQFIFGTHTE